MADVKHFPVNGVDLAVESRGEGKPLLLIHGGLGSRRDFRHLLPLLPDDVRAFAVDLRGHGASTPFGAPGNPWENLDVDVFTEDVLALLDAIAPRDKVSLLGHSLGGAVVQRVAAEAPERVDRLVVLASPPVPGEAFRARFAKRLADYSGKNELTHRSLAYFSRLPDGALPEGALKGFKGRALIVEPLDDPLYSPVQTMMWRGFLTDADLLHPDVDHDFHKTVEGARWLAGELARFLA